jgi:hypothetical protein
VADLTDRKAITDLHVRVCRDSGYRLESVRAAHFVADLLKMSALEVWIAMGSLDVTQRVADGTHRACQSAGRRAIQDRGTTRET